MSNENEQQDFIEIVAFSDDDGNKFEMELLEEFEHKDKHYAILLEYVEDGEDVDGEDVDDKATDDKATDDKATDDKEHEHGEDCDCGEESIYIFEVVQGENGEEFLSVDDDELMAELSEVVESILFEDEE